MTARSGCSALSAHAALARSLCTVPSHTLAHSASLALSRRSVRSRLRFPHGPGSLTHDGSLTICGLRSASTALSRVTARSFHSVLSPYAAHSSTSVLSLTSARSLITVLLHGPARSDCSMLSRTTARSFTPVLSNPMASLLHHGPLRASGSLTFNRRPHTLRLARTSRRPHNTRLAPSYRHSRLRTARSSRLVLSAIAASLSGDGSL
jgi:hypothetical protein